MDGGDYGFGPRFAGLLAHPALQVIAFCPEQHALGTPRSMPDLHGGDGFDVLDGRARVLDENGRDLTAGMLAGAGAMLALAIRERVELALLTDMSAACGSEVISDGCRLVAVRRFQRGVGVATAMLLRAGVPVLSQRDHRSLDRLRRLLDPESAPDPGARDHHEHPWTQANLPGPHRRA